MPDPQAWNGCEASHVSKVKSSQAVSRDAGNFGSCKATSQPQLGMMYGMKISHWYTWLLYGMVSSGCHMISRLPTHFVSSPDFLHLCLIQLKDPCHAGLGQSATWNQLGVLTSEGTRLAPESGRAQWKFQTDPGLPVSHGLSSTGRCPETGWLPNHPQPSATTHNKWWIFVNQESSKTSYIGQSGSHLQKSQIQRSRQSS